MNPTCCAIISFACMRCLMAIEQVAGVLLDPTDAKFLAGALEQFGRVLAERGSRPTPRLEALQRQLSRVSARVSGHDTHVDARIASAQHDSGVHLGYEFIDTARAAEILGVRPDSVRDLARRKTLPAVRAGGRWLYPAAAVVARAESRR